MSPFNAPDLTHFPGPNPGDGASDPNVPQTFKRFMLFEFQTYYPGGGVEDCSRSFDTLDEAVKVGELSKCDYVEIFDCDKRRIVWEFSWGDGGTYL